MGLGSIDYTSLYLMVYLIFLGFISLCIAISRRPWVGLLALVPVITMTRGDVGVTLASLALILGFWTIGRDAGTGLLTPGARLAAFCGAAVGLLVFLMLSRILV